MKTPNIPANERQRISALQTMQILDTLSEERFDRFTRLASLLFQVPIALISMIDINRQWFKSCIGLNVRETGRDISFCGHAILQEEPLIIQNALLDERFCDNPLVTGDPFIRFYAGYPLSTSEGYKVGTLCLIDNKPRKFDQTSLNAFRDLALIVQNELNNLELTYSIQEKIQAEQALVESEARYRTLVEVMREGIIVQDAQAQIVTFNTAAEQMFNLTGTSQKVKYFLDPRWKIVLEDGKPLALDMQPALVVLRTGQPVLNEVLGIYREDGSLQWLLVNAQPRFNPNQTQPFQVVSSFTDITQRKEIENRYKALSSAAFEGIAIISKDTIVEANQALSNMFGYELNELIGKNPQELVVSEARESITQNILNDYQLLYEVAGLKKDGFKLTLEIRSEKFVYKNQSARVAVVRDITQRKELERVKNEFISIVSHELRTPLTSIRGSLGLVVGGVAGEVAPQAKAMIEIAYKNSERLVRLINDILDIEKIESGKMVFNMTPIELNPIIEQAIEVNRPYAEQLGVNLILERPIIPALKIKADSDRLMQVLTNLLSNSAKFSPSGEYVSIQVETLRDIVRVNIIDKGPGIPLEFQNRIFQRFAQADSSDQRQKGGTGLGLSITKAIVEAHGGQVGFRTEPGAGTTFYFEIPRWIDREPIISDHNPSSKQPHILICEDDPDIATVMSNLFAAHNFSSDIVFGAAQAKDLLGRIHYDLLTLDLELTGQDGISLLRELRETTTTRKLPVVVVSANKDKIWEIVKECDLQVVDLVEKPIDPLRLISTLHKAIG